MRTSHLILATAILCGISSITRAAAAPPANLVKNSDFSQQNPGAKTPANFTLSGDADYRYMGDRRKDISGMGVGLQSARDLNADGRRSAIISQTVTGIDASLGRWYEFSFRGLPQDDFAVESDSLFMRAEFFADGAGGGGKTAMDGKEKKLYALIEQDRKNLASNGDHKIGGAAAWRTYILKFYLPFPQVDTLKLSVGFDHGSGRSAAKGSFLVSNWTLTRVDGPAEGYKGAGTGPILAAGGTGAVEQPKGTLIPLGGRWFYLAKQGETAAPRTFNYQNADRLIYHDNIWGTPFAGMMTAVLRAGDKDANGTVVTKDRLLNDNVTVQFDATAMIIHTKGVPNHPTGKFPENLDDGRRGNPNYVQEQHETFYIPLDPKERPGHTVTTANNSNHALPMGPIGVALNGVVFFNPFDMGNVDATNMMDCCCGHPNQENLYHYHKYPICLNSPWADEGQRHSPLIGFAFDGYPLYGPYAKAGVLAKDVKGDYALNDFNMHYDAQRGWHYQVTPGKFPYLIGGYWGTEDPRDKHHPGGGRGRGGPGAEPGPGGGQRGPGAMNGPPGGARPGRGNGPPPWGGPP